MRFNTEDAIKRINAYFFGTLFIFIITYYVVLHVKNTDYERHSVWALQLSFRHMLHFMQNYAAYPLWHVVTKTFYKILNFKLLDATATSTALFNCFTYWCVIGVWDFFVNYSFPSSVKSLWGCCLLLVGPLYAPWFSEYYYLGQGSGNVWHNPTNIAVKGFSVLCFVLIVQLLESNKTVKDEKEKYIFLCFLNLCSVFAKPSFLQGMIPGLGFYFIVSLIINKGKRESIIKYLFIASTFIPAVLMLAYQLVFSFFADTAIHSGGGIGIEFGRVLGNWSPNLFISFLLAFSFPLFILALDFRNLIKKVHIQVMLCYEFSAWGESALLYESGKREMDGNWLWGSYLSMFIVWMLLLFEYFNILSNDKISVVKRKFCFYGGSVLLFLHLICGIFYWYNITQSKGIT